MYDELQMLLKNFGVQVNSVSSTPQPEPNSEQPQRKLVDIMAVKLKNLIINKIAQSDEAGKDYPTPPSQE